jgi:Flp pilus assembly protein TadG
MFIHGSATIRQRIQSTRAQALVELAVMLPMLLLLILGAIDFGRLFMNKLVLTNAAREGANFISYYFDSDNPSASIEAARNVAIAEGTSSGITIEGSNIAFVNCCTPGSSVSVTVTKEVDLIFFDSIYQIAQNFFDVEIGDPSQISSTVTMMVQ